MKVKSKSQEAMKSAKKPSLLNTVKFNSPTLVPKQKQSSSSVQFYKSPSLVNQQGKDESTLGSLLKKMKQVQTPTTVKVREVRDEIQQKLQNLLKLGAKRGLEFILGFNSISKLAEQSCLGMSGASKNLLSVICISSDAKGELVHSLGQVAALNNIPIVLLPKLSPILQECFQLKRAFCFALRESSHSSDAGDLTQTLGQLDDLKEYLIRLSMQR